jgi:hypothetical protein
MTGEQRVDVQQRVLVVSHDDPDPRLMLDAIAYLNATQDGLQEID